MANLDVQTLHFVNRLIDEHKGGVVFWIKDNVQDPEHVAYLRQLISYRLPHDPLVKFVNDIDGLVDAIQDESQKNIIQDKS